MRRFFRYSRTFFCVLALLACIGAGIMRIRAAAFIEQVSWNYDRWLPDGCAAATNASLVFDKRDISFSFGNGKMGPPTGWLVAGYYINADASGGKPHWAHHRFEYDPLMEWLDKSGHDPCANYRGWGPARWIIV